MKRNLVTILLVLCLLFSIALMLQSVSVAQEKTTLTYYSWGINEAIWGGWIKDLVAKYEEQNPDIKIELQAANYADMVSIYANRCEAGVGPDIADFLYDSVPNFKRRGYIMGLNKFIEQEEPGFVKTWDNEAISAVTFDGDLYMIPMAFYPWMLLYNTEMFAEAGLDPSRPPRTMEEFIEYAKVLTRDTDGDGKIDQWGFGITAMRSPGLFLRFPAFIWSAGGDFLTEDFTSSALNSPETLTGFKTFVELVTKHQVAHPGAVNLGAHDVRVLMANKKVAMLMGTAPEPGIINNTNPELNALEILQFAPFPSYGEKPMFTGATMTGQVINANTKHPQEAWDFVKYLHSYENLLEAWYVNGWTPARNDVAQSEVIFSNKFGRALVENRKNLKFLPGIKEWEEISDIIITAIQNALSGIQTSEDALLEAHNKVNKILGN